MFPFSSLGTPEIVTIIVLALLVFGPKKLPEVGRSVGKAIREFKKNSEEIADSFKLDVDHDSSSTAQNEYVSQYGSYYGNGSDSNVSAGGDMPQSGHDDEIESPNQPQQSSERTNNYRVIARGRTSSHSSSRRRV